MRTAVVFYSLEGNVRYAAEKTAKALDAVMVELVPVKAYPDKGIKKFMWGGKAAVMKDKPELQPYGFSAGDYDLVVLCTPVWAGTFTPPLRSFLAENDLSGRKVAVIASSSGGNADKCILQLQKEAGVEKLVAQVSLVDPKARPTEENEARLAAFIRQLAEA